MFKFYGNLKGRGSNTMLSNRVLKLSPQILPRINSNLPRIKNSFLHNMPVFLQLTSRHVRHLKNSNFIESRANTTTSKATN